MNNQPKKRGRPLKNVSGKLYRYDVTLDVETVAKARLLGNGNLSEGLRRAVALSLPISSNLLSTLSPQ